MKIPFNKPPVAGSELAYIAEALSSGKLSGDGYFSNKCKSWFESKLSPSKVLLTPNCTQALEMAALLLDIEAGDEVIVFCPEGCPDEYMGARLIGVPAMPLPLYPELKLALPRPAVSEAIDSFQPDLIHVVNPAVLGLGGIWLAKSKSIPLIASYHTHLPKYLEHYGMGMLEPLLWELLKAAHNQALLNLCTSTAMVQELSDKGIQNTDLWQRGVDTDLFRPELRSDTMRARLLGGHDDRGALLLYVGRLSAEKQIERIRPVLETLPDARLALVGDGPHRQQLEKHFEGTATTFVGYLAGEELAGAYASGDAFLFPSSTETLGLVLLE